MPSIFHVAWFFKVPVLLYVSVDFSFLMYDVPQLLSIS